MLVVHSQFKITLPPVMVQAFLSQSTCLLTKNSNCKLTFLFFLCLTYTLAQTYEKGHNLHHNHAFNPKSFYNTISQNDKSVSLHIHQDQVKLFRMLQNMHTNYPQKNTSIYKHQPKSLKQCTEI